MNDFSLLLLLAAAVVVLWLLSRTSALRDESTKARETVSRLQTEVARLSTQMQQEAMAQFIAWREKEYDNVKRQQSEVATREARTQFEQWKVVSEASIRDDAIQRSRAVIVGKVTEHVVPYLPGFTYNPKDARFIGSPVDFVVFDGLDGGALEQIVFVEVKTGLGSLTKRERQIRDALEGGNVRWREIRVDAPSTPALQLPAEPARPTTAAAPRLTQTQSARQTCDSCGFVIEVTLRRGEDTTWCPQCGMAVAFNIDWNVR